MAKRRSSDYIESFSDYEREMDKRAEWQKTHVPPIYEVKYEICTKEAAGVVQTDTFLANSSESAIEAVKSNYAGVCPIKIISSTCIQEAGEIKPSKKDA